MQKKNKIIIGATSLIFIIAIVITMKFRIAKINNNELMKNEVSSIPKSEENEINKDEESSRDTTSSASEKEEAIKEDNSKASNSKKGDAISSASGKEKNKLVVSKNINHNKNSQNEEKGDTTSGASIKKENYLSSALNLNKLSEYKKCNNEEVYNNKKEDVISSASKKQYKNIPMTINAKHGNKDISNKNENKTATLDEVKISNDVVSSASKKEHKNIKNTSEKSEIKVNTDDFMNKVINKKATKLIDLGWAKYIVVTFNEGTIKDYDLYVLDNGNYKTITPSNVDDSGKIVKWEIDKLAYNTIKIKDKNSGKEVIYQFVK